MRQLDLNSNFLTGTIPEAIGNLASLRFLQLYDNRFEGTIPATIGELNNLRTISLHHNNLTGAVPEEICLLVDSNFTLSVDCLEVNCGCCSSCGEDLKYFID